MFKSSNPAFSTDAFQNFDYAAPQAATMTVQGTVSKTFLLLAILSGTALWSWNAAADGGVGGECGSQSSVPLLRREVQGR